MCIRDRKEVRAWTVRQGATAPQGAGRIHTDFEKGFIRAEVVAYDDFMEFQGEQGAKDAGKWRLEGKEYLMNEGDVVHFRFNVWLSTGFCLDRKEWTIQNTRSVQRLCSSVG